MNKIIFFTFIIVFLFKTGNVFSNEDVFYVDNIVVNNKDNQDREILLNKAFKKGFEKLIKKILLKKDQKVVLKTSLKDIKNMLSSYQVNYSDNLNKKDELEINLSFNREIMNKFFYSRDISYADISKTSLVLFPVLVENDNFYLFSDNYFFTNWNVNIKDRNNEFIDYVLPVENLEYIQLIENNKDNLESINIKEILSNYDIENYMFLVIKPYDEKMSIFIKGLFSDNKVIKNFDIYTNSEDKNSKFEKTVKKIKEEINEIWKSQNLVDVRTPSFLNIVLDIEKENDLLKVQTTLKKIELIENFYVLELTKNHAKIRIKYFGKINKMKDKFYEKGIILKNLNDQWKINLI